MSRENEVPEKTGEGGWVMVPRDATQAMCAAAVVFANGNAVYKNVLPEVLKLEESIYAEVYEAMIAAAPAPAVREPLTKAQLAKIAVEDEFLLYCDQDEFDEIARAIEQAHGIGGGGNG